jgi:hypothetical protein
MTLSYLIPLYLLNMYYKYSLFHSELFCVLPIYIILTFRLEFEGTYFWIARILEP